MRTVALKWIVGRAGLRPPSARILPFIVCLSCLGPAAAVSAVSEDLLAVGTSAFSYVIGRIDGTVLTSGVGGDTWTVHNTGATAPIRGVAYHANHFVIVGEGGRADRSSDGGISWTSETTTVSATLRDVVSHSLFLVAVGDQGTTIRRYSNAQTWSSAPPATSANLHSVASSGTILLAVGDVGAVLRSIDQGLSWAVQSFPEQVDLRGVAMNSNIAIAVGLGGALFRSLDWGISWVRISSPTADDLYDIFAGPAFIAVGRGGAILRGSSTGADGTWFDVGVTTPASLHGVLNDGSRYFVVGDSGVILRSLDGSNWDQVAARSESWSGLKRRFGVPEGP